MEEENKQTSELEEVFLKSLPQEKPLSLNEFNPPEELSIIPILKRPFFPGMAAPLVIEPGPYFELLKKIAKSDHKCLGLLLTKKEECDPYTVSFKDLYKVGTLARILKIVPLEQGGAQVIFNMEKRFKVIEPLHQKRPLKTLVKYHEEHQVNTKELKAYGLSILSAIKELLKLNPLFKEELQIFLSHSDFTEPGKLADFAAALTTSSREEQQNILSTYNIANRIEKSLLLLKKEIDLTTLQTNINQKIESTISKNQKDFFLKEQLKTIKRELGIEKDDKSIDKDKFELRLQDRKPSDPILEVIHEEIEKLSLLDIQSSEYAVSRGYLDWLTIIPWGVKSEECHDLKIAKEILDKDHFGLKDIKERILEFISVGKLTQGVKGSIICLVGPPGVGKTSIGRSIARALNRKFNRFSVGGMRDEAEIKGHRRTYIGAMPGKLVQALKLTQTMNPVIMLDEVDKMGSSFQGDPASALLEVLDPEQNKDFLDHYLDVPCDLSDVLFIVTANVLDTIPEPLLDRMEVLRLSGYILEEKIQIAEKYLIPRNRKAMGLQGKQVSFTKQALIALINGYAREAGVRNLESLIKKIFRKVAMEIVESPETTQGKKHKITLKNLEDYLGKPIFTSDRFYEETPVGVATGLAWTALGGAILFIETVKVPAEKTAMVLTGQAGDVMKESSQIAWSYLHSTLHKFAPEYTFFEKSQVHIHIPEGATPKDGPSAGVTMCTALLSLVINTPIKQNLAMTGEITLTGRILPVGGIKEKVVAARRGKIETLILPKENKRDFDELPSHIKEGLVIHYVGNYEEVFPIVFKDSTLS